MNDDGIPPSTAGRSVHGPVRVLVVDDLPWVSEALRVLLSLDPDIEVIGEARDGEEAVKRVEACRPDVVLMDVRMPGMNGLEATHIIKSRWPEVRVVLITVYPAARDEPFALEADAFLVKGLGANELREAVFGSGGRPSPPLDRGGRGD